ncbi:MAG: hypothetical protein ABIK62_08075 [candidate division WOR-3 bacterium]
MARPGKTGAKGSVTSGPRRHQARLCGPARRQVGGVTGMTAVLCCLGLGALTLSCLKGPRVPTWDTEVTIPLFTGTFHLMDVLPGDFFSVGPDSVIQFQAHADIDTIRPMADFVLTGSTQTTSFSLADLNLRGAYAARLKFGLEEVLGLPLPEEPTPLPIPPFEFRLLRIAPIDCLRSAELLRGTLILTVENHSNCRLDSIQLRSPVLGICRLYDIAPLDRREQRQRLGAQRIQDQNEFQLIGGSSGSGGRLVPVSRHDSLVIIVGFDSVRLAAACLRLPQAQTTKKTYLGVTAGRAFTLDSAVFAQGHAELRLVNDFTFPVAISLRIARLGFERDLWLEPTSSCPVWIDLTGRSLSNNSLTNSLVDVVARLTVPATADYVTITKDQCLTYDAQLCDLKPSFLAGELREPRYVTPSQESLPRLLPSGIPALRLPRCELRLKFTSAIGFRGRINLHIRARNRAGDTARLDRVLYLSPGSPDYPRTHEFSIPLYSVLSIAPEQIQVSYDIAISGRGQIQSAGYAAGRAGVATPLRLALCSDTVDLGGRVVELDQATRDIIARYLVSGEVSADLGNHFPLGMAGRVVLCPTDSGQENTDQISIPVCIPAGGTNDNHFCETRTDTTVKGELDEQSLVIFHNPRIRTRFILYLPETDTVAIRGQDYLNISSRAVLRLRVGGRDEAH